MRGPERPSWLTASRAGGRIYIPTVKFHELKQQQQKTKKTKKQNKQTSTWLGHFRVGPTIQLGIPLHAAVPQGCEHTYNLEMVRPQ